MDKNTIWTIGHSTRSIEEFVTLLHSFEIIQLVDIRSYPGSRRYPHFNKENLEKAMPANDILYFTIPELGGRRKPNPDSHNTALRHPAFRAYADYMETEDFLRGIDLLTRLAQQSRTCIMCSEAVWWRCHRSLVSDYLKSIGWKVIHIMGIHQSKEHSYTSAAHIIDGKLSYKGLL